jgi:site-specific recombinase XerD
MKDFEEYLFERRYRPSTIDEHLKNISYFFKWIETSGLIEVENIQYTDLLNYVQDEQKKFKDVSTINNRISSISKYFEFLKQQGTISRNPARTLRIRGKEKTIIQSPLTYDELLHLYNSYKAIKKEVPKNIQKKSNLTHQRNIVILGLLIWQGLHSGELEKLEVSHINLSEGIIYIYPAH